MDEDLDLVREMLARRMELVATLVREGKADEQVSDLPGPATSRPWASWKRAALEAVTDSESIADFRGACALAGFDGDAEIVRVFTSVGRRRSAPREEERTGMPCPDCDRKQKRMDVRTHGDGALAVRISYLIPVDKVKAEVKAVCDLLRMFVR